MALYQKLFGVLRSEFDDGSDLSGADRGDNLPDDEAPAPAAEAAEAAEEPAAEEPAAEAEEDEPARDDKGRFAKKDEPRIPKSRFDEAVAKERQAREAAEARLREIEAAQAQVRRTEDVEKIEAQVAELEKQHQRLLIDGEVEKAAEIASQIRRTERQIQIAEAQNMTAAAKEQAREEIRMELTIEKLESEYPVLSPENENYDPELVEFILAKQRGLMERERMSPSKALARATTEVMKRFGAPAPAAESKGLTQKVEDRKQAQVKKNLDAAARQPASTKEVGFDSDKAGEKALPDVSKMSYEEFDALPESTKAKLRGDYV